MEKKTLKKNFPLFLKCRMTSLESPDRKSGSSRENFLIAAAVGQNKTKPLRQKQNKTVGQKNLARSPTLLLSLTGHISNKTSDGVQFSFSEKLSWFTSPCGQFLSFTNREPLKRQGGVGCLFKIITWMHNFERLSTNFRLF